MAVEADFHSTAFDCANCDCVEGIAPEIRWATPGAIEPTNICYRYASRGLPAYLWSLFPMYQNGHLYRAGGIGDQPALFLTAMNFLQGYLRGRKN